jgi:hypothetical protein
MKDKLSEELKGGKFLFRLLYLFQKNGFLQEPQTFEFHRSILILNVYTCRVHHHSTGEGSEFLLMD